MTSSMPIRIAAATSGSPMTRRRPFRRLASSDESRTTKILRATRTREGLGRAMKQFTTRELTGDPEVPQTMRGFRDEKTHSADSADPAGGGNGGVANPRIAGARTGEGSGRSTGSGNPVAQIRNQAARK